MSLCCTIYTGVSSLVAAAAAAQRPLASEMVRLSGSLQSQPATEGMRAGLVRGKAVEGRAKPRMAKLFMTFYRVSLNTPCCAQQDW